eukprot:COSAG01_NODE_1680_length_9508_cov_4.530768_6_plen_75_part_00
MSVVGWRYREAPAGRHRALLFEQDSIVGVTIDHFKVGSSFRAPCPKGFHGRSHCALRDGGTNDSVGRPFLDAPE